MGHLISCSVKHNPYLSSPIPEHMLYPVSQPDKSGVDLDYSALLISEYFVLDEQSYSELQASRYEWLRPMQQSLKYLEKEELLFLDDFTPIAQLNRSAIESTTERLLEHREPWLRLAQAQWRTLEPELLSFQRDFGSKFMESVNVSHMGIESWLARSGQADNGRKRTALLEVLRGVRPATTLHPEDITGMLQFLVGQVVMTDLFSTTRELSILDWDDAAGLYDELSFSRWGGRDFSLISESRKLFSVIMPQLRPSRVQDVAKFIKKKGATSSLRAELLEAIDEGSGVSEEWLGRYVDKAVSDDIVAQKRARVFKWAGLVSSFVPGLPFVAGAGSALASSGAEALVGRKSKNVKWYYTLQENRVRP